MFNRKLALLTLAITAGSLAFNLRAQVCTGSGSGPTLKTITVDGATADWSNVLTNSLQVTNDGEAVNCATSTDLDCNGSNISGRDLRRFAWTYDNTNIINTWSDTATRPTPRLTIFMLTRTATSA